MKNTFGSSVAVTLFGESHGQAVGAVLDGLAPGIPVDEGFIAAQLALRRPWGAISTPRAEPDRFRIVSGVFRGRSCGTPITILIPNEDIQSGDYAARRALARPGHADYTAHVKYRGFEDWRGGGHFSGRITAALVAAGAIAISALRRRGVLIGTHIARCGGVEDRPFSADPAQDIRALNEKAFAVLDEGAGEKMRAKIAEAAAEGDSLGGWLETAVCGLAAGVGEPWFDTLEGLLAHGLFSIPGVKGVDFGGAFDRPDARGSENNDAFYMEGGEVRTRTNRAGGVNGGISNGMPLLFRTAVKPTPSVFKAQETVDFLRGEDAVLELTGRHDPAILHRARVVADSVTALILCDLLAQRFGTDWLGDLGAPAGAAEKSIVLTGMPGSGKSTLGALLAARTGRQLMDTDLELIRRAGMPIPEIFRTKGEEYFRDMESALLRELSAQGGKVIALGGGAVLRRENVEALKQNGTLVFLDRPLEELRPTPDRPLADSEAKLKALYERRFPIYSAAADVTVPVSGTPEETAERILEALKLQTAGGGKA